MMPVETNIVVSVIKYLTFVEIGCDLVKNNIIY